MAEVQNEACRAGRTARQVCRTLPDVGKGLGQLRAILRSPIKAAGHKTQPERRATVRLFDDGHVDGVVREQDFADVAEQDVDSLFAVDFLVAGSSRSRWWRRASGCKLRR